MQLSDMRLTEEKMMEEKYEMLIPEIGVDLNERNRPLLVRRSKYSGYVGKQTTYNRLSSTGIGESVTYRIIKKRW